MFWSNKMSDLRTPLKCELSIVANITCYGIVLDMLEFLLLKFGGLTCGLQISDYSVVQLIFKESDHGSEHMCWIIQFEMVNWREVSASELPGDLPFHILILIIMAAWLIRSKNENRFVSHEANIKLEQMSPNIQNYLQTLFSNLKICFSQTGRKLRIWMFSF